MKNLKFGNKVKILSGFYHGSFEDQSVTIDREKLAELLFGQEFYEGLSKVVRNQYLRKADKLISCQWQWMKGK